MAKGKQGTPPKHGSGPKKGLFMTKAERSAKYGGHSKGTSTKKK